jgi:hypothetical protein
LAQETDLSVSFPAIVRLVGKDRDVKDSELRSLRGLDFSFLVFLNSIFLLRTKLAPTQTPLSGDFLASAYPSTASLGSPIVSTLQEEWLRRRISRIEAALVVVRIRDAILVFKVLWLEGHLEPNYHFALLNVL